MGEAQGRQKLPFIGSSTTDGINRWTQTTLLLLDRQNNLMESWVGQLSGSEESQVMASLKKFSL